MNTLYAFLMMIIGSSHRWWACSRQRSPRRFIRRNWFNVCISSPSRTTCRWKLLWPYEYEIICLDKGYLLIGIGRRTLVGDATSRNGGFYRRKFLESWAKRRIEAVSGQWTRAKQFVAEPNAPIRLFRRKICCVQQYLIWIRYRLLRSEMSWPA